MVFRCLQNTLPRQPAHVCIGSAAALVQPQHQALNSPGRAARDRHAAGPAFNCEGHAAAGLQKAPAAAGAAGVPMVSAQGASIAACPTTAQSGKTCRRLAALQSRPCQVSCTGEIRGLMVAQFAHVQHSPLQTPSISMLVPASLATARINTQQTADKSASLVNWLGLQTTFRAKWQRLLRWQEAGDCRRQQSELRLAFAIT